MTHKPNAAFQDALSIARYHIVLIAMTASLVLGEDQPYMGLANAVEVRGLETTLAALPHAVVDVPVDAQAKCAAIFRHYVSQVEESYRTGVLARAAQLHGHERLYLLEPIPATRS